MAKTIRDKVRDLLEVSDSARNSDIALYVLYLQTHFCENIEEMRVIDNVFKRAGVNLAGLTRERAHIQNVEKEYLSDKQVEKFRKEKQEEERLRFQPSNPNKG